MRNAREKQSEARRTDAILEQIQDLKAAVLQTIDDKTGRNIARSVLQYRQLSEFLILMRPFGPPVNVTAYVDNFEELLAEFVVVEVLLECPGRPGLSPQTILLCEDGRLLRVRLVSRRFDRLASEWQGFSKLDRETKATVLQGVEDASGDRGALVHECIPPSGDGDGSEGESAGQPEDPQDGICHGLTGVSSSRNGKPATLTWTIDGETHSIGRDDLQASFAWLSLVPRAIFVVSNGSSDRN